MICLRFSKKSSLDLTAKVFRNSLQSLNCGIVAISTSPNHPPCTRETQPYWSFEVALTSIWPGSLKANIRYLNSTSYASSKMALTHRCLWQACKVLQHCKIPKSIPTILPSCDKSRRKAFYEAKSPPEFESSARWTYLDHPLKDECRMRHDQK